MLQVTPKGGSLHGYLPEVIEIPGYRLLRQLGRGGMATVYLAVQESVDREVALKIMSPALLVDPNFGERFLREAKIAARLHHRHVVGIHDVSRIGDYHYIAMEYLAGGPVLSKDGPARPVSFALRVTREIAGAINYAQQKGFIHRDIKPDNILLRDDGSAALTDFGIARANDSATRMTRTGAVVGTPHYMSPEQARGKQLDGRADLYSLGVVLYEMLLGRVPFHAEDSLAVGIMHITEPVPRLPDSLSVLQPLVDGLLAKEPHDRFQTGNDAAIAISRYEQAIASGELEGLDSLTSENRQESHPAETRVSPLPLTQQSPQLESPDGVGRSRADPNMGRLEEIMAATDDHIMRARRSTQQPSRGNNRRTGLWITLIVLILAVAAGGGLLWKNQEWLRAFLPSTELNDILTRAQQAADADNLDGNQGNSARELFERARALDLDNEIARRGLRNIGEKLLARARDSLARNDGDTARKAASSARELLGGGAAVDEVDKAIASIDARETETEALLEAAQQALDAGRVLGDDGAVALFQRMLAGDPDNSLAKAGISRSASALASQAEAAFAAGELDTVSALIEDVARTLPTYPGLPELRARLASQREAAKLEIEKVLAKGDLQLRAGRYTGGADSALTLFESVLDSDPSNARAREGLRRVAQALVKQAQVAVEEGNPGSAEKLLKQAATLAPDVAGLRGTQIELRELRERQAIAAERPPLSPADTQRMQVLVAEAALAVRAGRLISPPGNSAYDKYRAALAIDGNNQDALNGLNQLPVEARQLFDQNLGEGSLTGALGMLEVVRQVSPADTTLVSMSALLATAYLDQAEQQVARKQLEDARRSVQTARTLSPNHPRLGALEQQLGGQPAPVE